LQAKSALLESLTSFLPGLKPALILLRDSGA